MLFVSQATTLSVFSTKDVMVNVVADLGASIKEYGLTVYDCIITLCIYTVTLNARKMLILIV